MISAKFGVRYPATCKASLGNLSAALSLHVLVRNSPHRSGERPLRMESQNCVESD